MEQKQIIEALSRDLRAELSAVEMYAAHAEAIPHRLVAQGVRAIMTVERRHARDLTLRLKALGASPPKPGGPETVAGQAFGAISEKTSTMDMLRLELAEEQQAINDYAEQIAEIMTDEETMDLLEEHLADEIQHARWLKAQIAVLSREESR